MCAERRLPTVHPWIDRVCLVWHDIHHRQVTLPTLPTREGDSVPSATDGEKVDRCTELHHVHPRALGTRNPICAVRHANTDLFINIQVQAK